LDKWCSQKFAIKQGEEENEYVETSGYFDGYDWIYKSCFRRTVMAENIETITEELEV
jgi:hypothetical protein